LTPILSDFLKQLHAGIRHIRFIRRLRFKIDEK